VPYSAIDNVLTNLLPAGLQDFFQVLNVSSAMTTLNKLLECSQIKQSTGFKSRLFGGQFSDSTNSDLHEDAKTQLSVVNDELAHHPIEK